MSATTSLDAAVELIGGDVREVTLLPGGLTNANHKVVTDVGTFVVRCWDDDTSLLAIDRDNEYENSLRAARAGVGAPVVGYLPEHNAMVFEFVAGETMSAEKLRSGAHLAEVADACRRLHGAERFRDDFDMFAIQPRYRRIVGERGFRLPERYDEFEPHVEAIRDAFAVRDEGTAPCNNDLLAENFILSGDRFVLIDYEYSGNNDDCFELGNISTECDLEPDQVEHLVTSYDGRASRQRLARVRLQMLVSAYGWSLWGAIQATASHLDYDFAGWGRERFEKAARGFTSDGFERLLEEATGAD